MKNFALLIHHHAVAHQDSDGNIHVASFIGRWVNALAEHVGEIRLLLYESKVLLPQQDEMINKKNVSLWSLGPPGKTWDRIPRMRRLREVCIRASENADGLLIRGSTPRQMSVWKAVNVPHKAFLLVGSLLQSRLKIKINFWSIYEHLIMQWRQREILKIASKGLLLANSPLLVSELAGLGRNAIFVPTNTISINEFPPVHVRKLSAPRKILFCGRVVPEKGIRELLYALAELNRIEHYELDVVGPISVDFHRELIWLTDSLGIFQKIRWHGHVPYGEKLMRFYQDADVFVLPTYFEGFPHVIWEAAANSCPVITTHVGGIPMLWKHNEHGLLISSKNSLDIKHAVVDLFDNDALRAQFIENAYSHAMAFTVEVCVNQLIDVFKRQGWSQSLRKNIKTDNNSQ